MNYFFLFLICFVPLVSLKWSLSRPASSSSSSPGGFSFTHSRGKAASPPPPPAPSHPPPPPSPSMLYRLFTLLWRTATPRARTRARARVPPFPPPPPPPSSSSYYSQYSYFASPPVVRIPTSPSPVSRWFSSSSSSHGGRTRARKAPSWTSRDRFRRTPPLSSYARARNVDGVITMTAFLGTEGSNVDVDLVVLMAHVQAACKHIASLLATPRELQQESASSAYETEFRSFGGDDDPRPMITISNNILQMALRSSGQVAAISSQEDDAPTWFGDGPYIVVFDPLDGSRDFDDHTPTGTIFGIYHRILEADHLPLGQKAAINVMQRGERLVAAGYALYSSATMLCISVGSGLYGFSLDNEVGEFVLTHPDIRIPERGHIYSINDGRYFDWPPGLQHYVDTIRQGRGQNPRRYSARYIASLTADLHRTILYGGIAMNPRSQLQLVHEANALSFLVEQGGGRAIDGRRRILEIQPTHLHQRLSLFLGSRADVSELEAYGDVQQVINIHPEYDDDDEL